MPLKSYLVALLGLGLAASSAYATVTVDSTTKGTWKSPSKYGTDGYILPDYTGNAGGGVGDKTGDTTVLPSYITSYSFTGQEAQLNGSTSDTNGLQNPANTALRAVGDYFSTTSFTVTLVPNTTKSFNLDLYFSDFNGAGTRADTITFTGAGANVPASDSVSNFDNNVGGDGHSGIWHVYPVTVTNGTNLVITFTNANVQASVSAIMFDPVVVAPEPASLSLLALGGATLLMRRRKA